MQIVETVLARASWFIDLKSLNPSGLAMGPVSYALVPKYRFLIYPTKPEEFDLSKGISYRGGAFEFEKKNIELSLTVYTNGWMADTLVSTEASEAFLSDVVKWLSENFGFRSSEGLISRVLYDSQLVFHSDIDLTRTCEKISAFTEVLRKLSKNRTEEVFGFVFQPDQDQNQIQPPTLTVERRVNVPYSEKKYYSKSTLPTNLHLKALTLFEKMFA